MSCGCPPSKPSVPTPTLKLARCSTASSSSGCAGKLPFMEPWSQRQTPYVYGAIVTSGGCVWAQTDVLGEYAPPGAVGSGWVAFDQRTLVELVTSPKTFITKYVESALADPTITSKITLGVCNV